MQSHVRLCHYNRPKSKNWNINFKIKFLEIKNEQLCHKSLNSITIKETSISAMKVYKHSFIAPSKRNNKTNNFHLRVTSNTVS